MNMKRFACGDVIPGSAATFTADTEDALLGQVAQHAADHGLATVPDGVVATARHFHDV